MKRFTALGALGLLIILVLAACTAPAQNQQTASIQESLQITVYKSPT